MRQSGPVKANDDRFISTPPRMNPKLAIGIALTLLATLTLGDEPEPRKLAAATEGERSFGESIEELKFLIGEWTLDAWYAAADGSKTKTQAKLTGRLVLDGLGLQTESRYPSPGEGQPDFIAVATYVFNPRVGKILGSGINTLGNSKNHEVRFEGDKIIVLQTGMQFGGRPGINRSVYYDIEPDRFHLRYDYSPDGGKTWNLGEFGYLATRRNLTRPGR